MRKASQDGGDSTSITSGLDTDIKKPGAGILKTKKTSIKRKVQNFSLDSDDGGGEPLLQKEKEKIETGNQSAKFFLSKTKTDSMSDKSDERDKLLDDNKTSVPSMTSIVEITDSIKVFANGVKDNQITKTYASAAPIHNHMNTNVFACSSRDEVSAVPKTQVLVDIDGQKQKSCNPSPLIFTTAKIHTDGNIKPLEPVHVTPMPILSTIEGRFVKVETAPQNLQNPNVFDSSKKDNILGYAFKINTTNTNNDNDSATNNVSYAGIVGKTTSSTTFACQPFVVTQLKTFKYIPSEGKLKDISVNKDNTSKCEDKTQINNPATDIVNLEKGDKNVAPIVSTVTQIILPSGSSSNKATLHRGLEPSLPKDTEMDINKNVQHENVTVSKQTDTTQSINPNVRTTNISGNIQIGIPKKALKEDIVIASKETIVPPVLSEKSKDLSSEINAGKSANQACLDTTKMPSLSSKINTASSVVSNSPTAAVSCMNTTPFTQKSATVTTLPKFSSTPLKADTKLTITNAPPTCANQFIGPIITTVESNIPKLIKPNGTDNFPKRPDISVAKSLSLVSSTDTVSNTPLLTSFSSNISETSPSLTSKSKQMPILSAKEVKKAIASDTTPVISQKISSIPLATNIISSTTKTTTTNTTPVKSQKTSSIPLATNVVSSIAKTIITDNTPVLSQKPSNIPLTTTVTSNIAKTTTNVSSQGVSNIPLTTSSKLVTTKSPRTQIGEVKSPVATTTKFASSGVESSKLSGIPVSLGSVTSEPSTVSSTTALVAKDLPTKSTEVIKAPTAKTVINKKDKQNGNEKSDT